MEPAGHVWHSVCPVAGAASPVVHATHASTAVAPDVGLCVPVGHATGSLAGSPVQ